MITNIHLPLLVSVLLAGISPVLAARLSPARAGAALVAASAAAAAASTAWALLLLAATLAPAAPLLSGRVAVIAIAVVTGLTAATIRVANALRRRRRVTRQLRALCETCGIGRAELVVAPIAYPHAFAVPGHRGHSDTSGGRILVTVGMLRALDAAGRRMLLAHERAHLTCHHHRQRAIMEVAAALNPLLIPARAAVAYLVERAADEHAATIIGDRRVAADALAAAALASTPPARRPPCCAPGTALAYSRFGVARRVAALHAAPLPERRLPPILLTALAAITAAETLHTVAAFTFTAFVHVLVPGM